MHVKRKIVGFACAAVLTVASAPSAQAVTEYTGSQYCPTNQNAAIQGYHQGYQNHRIYDFQGGVVKFRQLPYFDSYAIYRATSKAGLSQSYRMGNASGYASISLPSVAAFCTPY